MKTVTLAALLAILSPAFSGLAAQGYRVRMDLRTQGAAYRGVLLDSVPATQVVTGPDGGPRSAEGFAVRCSSLTSYCLFFRPGAIQRAAPATATADLSVWGLGIPGLSLRATTRAHANLGRDAGPGATPRVELLEGYGEYDAGFMAARAGRMQALSRLGSAGYDGASISARSGSLGIDASAFGGLGLARAAAIPINSPLLDPLDQYQPARRQLMAGGSLGWTSAFHALRVSYLREVDRRSQYFISERSALEATVTPPIAGLGLSAAVDWDLANNWLGTAEAHATFHRGPVAASLGGRRYRPQFDLWTIWGAFSPVPYRAGTVLLRVAPMPVVTISGRGELYRYDPSGAESGLVEVKDRGSRWSVRMDAAPRKDLDLSAAYGREIGTGAASGTWDVSATWRPGTGAWIMLTGAHLQRPLELRFDDAEVWMAGVRAEVRPRPGIAVSAGASRIIEDRDRPDAARIEWSQVRFHLRVSVDFGSRADAERLPPAVPAGR